MDFFRVFITAPISLTVLFLLAKLMGNKQMSELNMFDYINGITIGSIAAELATGEFTDIYDGVMAMVIYSLIAIMLTFLSQKSLLLRRFITGKSIIIYDNGKFYNKNLSTAKIDINEILVMCRSKGYFNFDEIQTVILESNGQLSILPKDKNRPLTPDDMKITVLQSGVEAVVIQDGKVLERNLKATGNNIEWLKKELKKQNIKTSEVFIAFCDNNNTLKVHKKVKSNPTNDIFDEFLKKCLNFGKLPIFCHTVVTIRMVLYMCKITTDKTYITKLITHFFIDIFLSLFYKQSARLRSGFCFF